MRFLLMAILRRYMMMVAMLTESDPETTLLGKNRWLGYNFYTLLAGIPMKATFVIKNVSTSATEFSVVKIPFKYNSNGETYQYIEFRNLPISAQ